MGCVHRHSSSSPEPAYVSVGCTLHACPATHPCPWTFISVLRSGWFDFAIRRSMAYPPHVCQSLPRAWKRSCLRPASVAPCFVLQKNKKPLGTSRENALLERKKNRCMGAQARKEGLQQTRGHWTARRQLPTASTNAHRRAGGSCMAGHWFSADVCSSSRHRHC